MEQELTSVDLAMMDFPSGNVRDGEFDDAEFLNIPDVPVFAEHETVAGNGRQIKFAQPQLEAVMNRNNQRINETGDYPALTLGHTPGPEQRSTGAPMPEVVGFAGPFKIGKIGRPGQRQRYAILADFHVFRKDADKVRKHPRRSPELWLEEKYEDMFLDPIALLGAEAPRLDLGLLYARQNDSGVTVEKYAASMASAGNTFIPSHGDEKKYESEPERKGHIMLSPEDVGQIVDALEQLDWVQGVKSLLAESAVPGEAMAGTEGEVPEIAQPDVSPPPSEPQGAATAPPAAPAAPPTPEPAISPPGGEGVAPGESPMDPEKMRRYAAADEMDEDEFDEYSKGRKAKYAANETGEYQTADQAVAGAKNVKDEIGTPVADYEASGSVESDSAHKPAAGTVEPDEPGPMGQGSASDVSGEAAGSYATQKYSRAISEVNSLRDQVAKQGEMLQYERAKRVDSERFSVLADLQHQGYCIDPAEQIDRCKYGKMSDDQFSTEVEFIAKSVQRVPFHDLPTSSHATFQDERWSPGAKADKEHYSKKLSDQAMKICEDKALRGEAVNYELELEKLKSGG